jgi:alkylation response protein AidB-like acyl-CoA dehydrogenase
VDFTLPPADDPRRLAVRAWLDAHPDPSPDELAGAGLVAPGWPPPWGLGADPEHQLIINQELEQAGVDPHGHNPIGIGWAGPTILAAGTEDQKRRFLGPILTGEEFWSQLFSEPGAGSDLAGLTTTAVRDGDSYVVNGQKVWSTWASRADYGILLARTDAAAPRHRGISYFLCPMRQPGVEVRPIKEMTGQAHFTEVFFTDARVPAGHLLGKENEGWALAKLTLGNERISLSQGGVLWGMGPSTAAVVAAGGRPLPPLFRQRAVGIHIGGEILRLLGYRVLTSRIHGRPPGPEAAVKKLVADRHGQLAMDYLRDLSGAGGLGGEGEETWGYLFSRALTIGGGTAEVLRNIIGENLLGLPKEVSG